VTIGRVAIVVQVAKQDHAGTVAHDEHDLAADLRCPRGVDRITRLEERSELDGRPLEHDPRRPGAVVEAEGP
jgi:hypothetical protein